MKSHSIRQLAVDDVKLFRELLGVFGDAFEDTNTYCAAQPGAKYLEDLLGDPGFIALAAFQDAQVIAGLAAYVLKKFEQARKEIYIYDIAVTESCRRKGVATALIAELKRVAAECGAYVIYVQADVTDPPAIALYTKLGTREEVLHFDIEVK